MIRQFTNPSDGENRALVRAGIDGLPAVIAEAGAHAGRRFVEFFTANIRNRNTRMACAQAVRKFFSWCEDKRLDSSGSSRSTSPHTSSSSETSSRGRA